MIAQDHISLGEYDCTNTREGGGKEFRFCLSMASIRVFYAFLTFLLYQLTSCAIISS